MSHSQRIPCTRCSTGFMYYDPPRWFGDPGGYKCPICGERSFAHAYSSRQSPKETKKEVPPPSRSINISAAHIERRERTCKLISENMEHINGMLRDAKGWETIAKFLVSINGGEKVRGDYVRESYLKLVPKEKWPKPDPKKLVCSRCPEPITAVNKTGLCKKCYQKRKVELNNESRKQRLLKQQEQITKELETLEKS